MTITAAREMPDASAAVTVNGTTQGYIGVASNAAFAVGAKCFMSNGTTSVAVQIVDVTSTNTIGLRNLPVHNDSFQDIGPGALVPATYGQSDASAYTVAGSWVLYMPKQLVPAVGY